VSRERITTVTFDFWGTIVVDGPGSDERYRFRRLTDFATILAAAGHPVERGHLNRAYERSMAYLTDLWNERRDVGVEAHVRAILDGVDDTLADRLSADTLTELVEAHGRPATMFPPIVDAGALTALETLCARGYTLAVVSNTMRTPGVALRKILERYGLLGCFKQTTFSDEVGIRKPDPEIFAMTLRQVQAKTESAVHVGDDPVLDVEGARAAGMRVIQVSSMSVPALGAGGPDAVVPDLSTLPAAIAALDA